VSAQLDQRLGPDSLDQMAENIVKHTDRRFTEAVGIVQKQIGDASKGFDALFGRADVYGLFELDNKRLLRVHAGTAPQVSDRIITDRMKQIVTIPNFAQRDTSGPGTHIPRQGSQCLNSQDAYE
jgi:hypothetical protein